MSQKPKLVKDYEKLDEHIQEQIKLAYPLGFDEYLVSYKDSRGDRVTALPFETDEKYYLVRMTKYQAQQIISDDDDYDDDGTLREDVKESYSDKYSELDYMSDYIADEEPDDD